jgi:hypothetical protein
MQHSVKFIGEQYQRLSEMRKEKKLFSKEEFLVFAKEHSKKYSIIENGEDLLVSTWHSGDLIDDYKSKL